MKQAFLDHIELWLSALGLVLIGAIPYFFTPPGAAWKVAAFTAASVGALHGVLFWVVRHRREALRAQTRAAIEAQNEALEERVREQTEAIRQHERRLQALVDASAQIVWSANAEGKVEKASASWEAFTGQPFEAYRGDGFFDAIHPDERAEAKEKWERAIEAQEPFATELRLYHAPSQRYRWTEVRGVPVFGSGGALIGWTGMNIDIDERRRATRRVRELALALAEAEQTERQRIAGVLHDDVQQDLYAVEVTVRQMCRQFEGKIGEEAHAQLEERCDQLEALLGQAFAATRTLSAELSPAALGEADVGALCRWLAEHMKQRYDLDVKLDVEEETRIESRGLRATVLRLVRELLFNVVKHAEIGHAQVEAYAREAAGGTGGGGGALTFAVCDEGNGFDPERLEDQRKNHGLSHMRERVRLVGGRLQVESAPGEGTRVSLTVPTGA